MSRKYNRADQYDTMYDEYDNDSVYHQQLKERRKLKRLKNAIRSRNIDDLMRDEDDDYDMY